MQDKKLLIIFFVILALVILAAVIYFLLLQDKISIGPFTAANSNDAQIKQQQADQTKNDYNQKFPDVITGIVNIVSDSETIIKTEKGDYLIFPARPMSFYSDSGIKNNSQVRVQGRMADGNKISLGNIVPL